MSKKIYDLVIIGAGVLGSFHAYHALKKGHSVLLLEKDQLPQGATVRNFGQIVPSGMKGPWFDYGVRSLEVYRQIQEQYDLTVRKQGSVYLASDDQEQQLLHELKTIMDERDYPCQFLSPRLCQEKWPALSPDYVKEGLFFPHELNVDPRQMIKNMITFMLAKFENLDYRSACPAHRLDLKGEEVQVYTNDDNIFSGKQVLISNGAEFKLLLPEIYRQSGLIVSKLQMMRSRPKPDCKLEGNILTGLTIRRYESFSECPSYNGLRTSEHYRRLQEKGIHILFKQAADGSIIIGDSHEYAPAEAADSLGYEIDHYINELIIDEAQRIVNLQFDQLSATWAGFYSQHPDDIFYQCLENKIHILTGIGGKGMTSSPGFAEANLPRIMQN